jgi:hypothetical protein
MESQIMFLDCPAYLDSEGAARCGLPAEVEHWYTLGSTDGPMEGAKIRCPLGHWFNGPVEMLSQSTHPAGTRQRAPGAPQWAGSARRLDQTR